MTDSAFPHDLSPASWDVGELGEAEVLRRIIAVAETLLPLCDVVHQQMAGNYISMALDILRADADLKAEMKRREQR